jgi:hypothetical protein
MTYNDCLKQIIEKLSVFSREVELHNSLTFYDINKYAESFYAAFLNTLLDYNLKDLNCEHKNSSAIDLADKDRGICIQVTSEERREKYKETLQKYVDNKLYETYPELIILLIKKKTINHKDKEIKYKNHVFDVKKDLWDIDGEILRLLNSVDLERLQKVLKVTKDYIDSDRQEKKMTQVNNTFNLHNFSGLENANFGGTQTINYYNHNNYTFDQAKNLFNIGDYSQAKKILSNLIQFNQDDSETTLLYVLSLMAKTDLSRLSQAQVDTRFGYINKFLEYSLFKRLWLILYFEFYGRKHRLHCLKEKYEEIASSTDLTDNHENLKLFECLDVYSENAKKLIVGR